MRRFLEDNSALVGVLALAVSVLGVVLAWAQVRLARLALRPPSNNQWEDFLRRSTALPELASVRASFAGGAFLEPVVHDASGQRLEDPLGTILDALSDGISIYVEGRAGAGKSALFAQLHERSLREAIAGYRSFAVEVVHARSWDKKSRRKQVALLDWASRQMASRHTDMSQAAITAFINSARVRVVVDGLDESTSSGDHDIMEAIEDFATRLPVAVSSRPPAQFDNSAVDPPALADHWRRFVLQPLSWQDVEPVLGQASQGAALPGTARVRSLLCNPLRLSIAVSACRDGYSLEHLDGEAQPDHSLWHAYWEGVRRRASRLVPPSLFDRVAEWAAFAQLSTGGTYSSTAFAVRYPRLRPAWIMAGTAMIAFGVLTDSLITAAVFVHAALLGLRPHYTSVVWIPRSVRRVLRADGDVALMLFFAVEYLVVRYTFAVWAVRSVDPAVLWEIAWINLVSAPFYTGFVAFYASLLATSTAWTPLADAVSWAFWARRVWSRRLLRSAVLRCLLLVLFFLMIVRLGAGVFPVIGAYVLLPTVCHYATTLVGSLRFLGLRGVTSWRQVQTALETVGVSHRLRPPERRLLHDDLAAYLALEALSRSVEHRRLAVSLIGPQCATLITGLDTSSVLVDAEITDALYRANRTAWYPTLMRSLFLTYGTREPVLAERLCRRAGAEGGSLLAEVLVRQGRTQEADSMWNAVLADPPTDATLRRRLWQELEMRGRLADVSADIDVVQVAIADQPGNWVEAFAWDMTVRVEGAEGWRRVKAGVERSLAGSDVQRQQGFALVLGRCLFEIDRDDAQALAVLEAHADQLDAHPILLARLAQIHISAGRRSEARVLSARAMQSASWTDTAPEQLEILLTEALATDSASAQERVLGLVKEGVWLTGRSGLLDRLGDGCPDWVASVFSAPSPIASSPQVSVDVAAVERRLEGSGTAPSGTAGDAGAADV